ncbi:MAG: hypothetical protein IKI31_00100 [Treponema sp.]|nr:hypothetical protein [Treponema sp.]
MATFDKIKDYINKGFEVSKNALDKGMEASKDALNKAGNVVQDFSDKSVVRIERKQFESKKNEVLLKLGEVAFQKLSSGQSVSSELEEVSSFLTQIKSFNEEIEKRDALLREKCEKKQTKDKNEDAETVESQEV